MARGRRTKDAPPVEAEEDEQEQDEDMEVEGAHVLEFDEALTWPAGRPLAVAELLRRLKTLYQEISTTAQEDAHRTSTEPKAKELASKQLLGHKDAGVKAWTLLNIVEMFRLLAPNAPYKAPQLKDIFSLFVSTIVPAMANPNDPYNEQHMATTASLHTVRSICLLTDIPGADVLILNLFANCFDVMSGDGRRGAGEQLSKNVEYNMTALLCLLVDEMKELPSSVVDMILAQFLRADPSLLAGKKKGEDRSIQLPDELSPAYNMARSICNTCEEQMVRGVAHYFNSVLIDATENIPTVREGKAKPRSKKRTRDDSDDESDAGLLTPPAEVDLDEVAKAHRLLRELWRSCPDVVRNVIPLLEAELGAENLQLRTMAVQTVGDMIAGIGAAGPPPSTPLDPAAYPSQSLEPSAARAQHNVLLVPAAPHNFSSIYLATYLAFVDRARDKAAQVRAVWVTEAGRIISTSGGGKGLDTDQEKRILRCFADMLVDGDERVRLSAVQAVVQFDYHLLLQKLGTSGGVQVEGSILGNLASRIKDPKPSVRTTSIELLGRIWGVAFGAISEGSDRVRELLGSIPSKIFDAVYVNDRSLNAVVQQVLFDSLLPVGFPPIKSSRTTTNGDSQRIADSQGSTGTAVDPDGIRVERLLVLVRDLEEKARAVFFSMQQAQGVKARYMEAIIKHAEDVNAGPGKSAEKNQLEKLIKAMSSQLADPVTAETHLKSFVERHDKRSFVLARFSMSPESDYKKVANALKEISRRIEQGPAPMSSCAETVLPLLRTASLLVYNRSHLPAILDFARTDENGLGSAAQEVLKDISAKAPRVFSVHIKDLCETLKKQAPTATTANDASSADSLKACAGFARRFPEQLGQDRAFYQAMSMFTLHGSPPKAAKHAVTVIISSAEKKEMYIKDILKSCVKAFTYGQEGFLSKLAALAQLRLLAAMETEPHDDAISEIATGILQRPATADGTELSSVDEEGVDNDLSAKIWALKIIVNGLRGRASDLVDEEASEQVHQLADKTFRLLNTLVEQDGELVKSAGYKTPEAHQITLRLESAKLILKLCCNRTLERLFAPSDLNRLTKIAQDALPAVREPFNNTLKKYLSLNKLPRRFYGLMFLYAFEPVKDTKERTMTFLKARATNYARTGDGTMESVLAYFLSLLAHHPDFSTDAGDLEDFVDYILFYLKIVATERNLPLLYNVAQRLKTVQDGIDPGKSENLYVLSDLTEGVLRYYAEFQQWSLQIVPARPKLPSGLFAPMPSHAFAQEVSEKRFLPDDLAEYLEMLVWDRLRKKKNRKLPDESTARAAKKVKTKGADKDKTEKVRKQKSSKASKPAKTLKRKATEAAPESKRRKSARASNAKSYVEADSEDDDEDLEKWQAEEQREADDEEADKENKASSTPPTSDPTPLPASTGKERLSAKKAASQKRVATVPKKAVSKTLPARGGRTRSAKKAKGEFDLPSDSDRGLSDAPSELAA